MDRVPSHVFMTVLQFLETYEILQLRAVSSSLKKKLSSCITQLKLNAQREYDQRTSPEEVSRNQALVDERATAQASIGNLSFTVRDSEILSLCSAKIPRQVVSDVLGTLVFLSKQSKWKPCSWESAKNYLLQEQTINAFYDAAHNIDYLSRPAVKAMVDKIVGIEDAKITPYANLNQSFGRLCDILRLLRFMRKTESEVRLPELMKLIAMYSHIEASEREPNLSGLAIS
mmetsp:Transcript_7239/g.13384  ORF Transcript_7239/g.13384 Transcript_7239/m.13384 type:complete len:229 (+) Transcript_7239:3665-4351(+)